MSGIIKNKILRNYIQNLPHPLPEGRSNDTMAEKMAADLSPTDNDALEALLQVSSLRTDTF